MSEVDSEAVTLRNKLRALYAVIRYRPLVTVSIMGLSVSSAVLEGIGLSFLVPVIEIAQGNTDPSELSGVGERFFDVYTFLGIPFELAYVIAGVGAVMSGRYISTFLVSWLQSALRNDYIRHLQIQGFKHALDVRLPYYDKHGTEKIMNMLVTQLGPAGSIVVSLITIVQQTAMSLAYLGIALYIAPVMTILTGVILGSLVVFMRYIVESGYSIGDQIAKVNEGIHENAQSGTQGIRDVRVFGLTEEVFDEFARFAAEKAELITKKDRNEAAMDSIYRLMTSITVFILVYFAIVIASLSVSTLGVFLFAIFRLSPRVSTLNNSTYSIDNQLPHLVRTRRFIDDLSENSEPNGGSESPPSEVKTLAYENVTFAYNDDEQVLTNVSFEVKQGEFIAFVGPSGTGKSTIVSLLTRLYEPGSGRITANSEPINQFHLSSWREKVAMVRQHPFIFNESVRYNVTMGNRDATEAEIREACEIAKVTEFLDELPEGLDTKLGDKGVRLSGGQRQRIAIARAVLDDADVLVMDEATSDLDTRLEENIQANLEASERDRILIVIAHRLSTVVNADRIYTMEDSEISEAGPHAELIEQDGVYAELYTSN